MELLTSFCLCFLKKPVRQDGVYGAVTKQSPVAMALETISACYNPNPNSKKAPGHKAQLQGEKPTPRHRHSALKNR